MKKLIILSLVCTLVSGCMSVTSHRAAIRDDSSEKLSIAKVQREIRTGMYTADVVSILGAPNMVTTDEKRRETWVYDKVATEHVYSTSSGGLGLALGGATTNTINATGMGGAGGSYAQGSGGAATSQRTITIIIKFDEAGKVRDYSYRQSSF